MTPINFSDKQAIINALLNTKTTSFYYIYQKEMGSFLKDYDVNLAALKGSLYNYEILPDSFFLKLTPEQISDVLEIFHDHLCSKNNQVSNSRKILGKVLMNKYAKSLFDKVFPLQVPNQAFMSLNQKVFEILKTYNESQIMADKVEKTLKKQKRQPNPYMDITNINKF